ncbi:type II toxin-antitoxin system RelE/ParE family toxin [Fulvimarina sp. MAC8]
MHVRLSSVAEADLDTIFEFIARDDEVSARRTIDSLLASIYYLERFPLLGRPGRVEGTRELKVPRIPYLIVYSIPDPLQLDVQTIIHTKRQYP